MQLQAALSVAVVVGFVEWFKTQVTTLATDDACKEPNWRRLVFVEFVQVCGAESDGPLCHAKPRKLAQAYRKLARHVSHIHGIIRWYNFQASNGCAMCLRQCLAFLEYLLHSRTFTRYNEYDSSIFLFGPSPERDGGATHRSC